MRLSRGRCSASDITRSACGYGSGRHSTASTTLKMAVFAPMPSASARTATSGESRLPPQHAHAERDVLSQPVPHVAEPPQLVGDRRQRPAVRGPLPPERRPPGAAPAPRARHSRARSPRRSRISRYSSCRSPAIGSRRSPGMHRANSRRTRGSCSFMAHPSAAFQAAPQRDQRAAAVACSASTARGRSA